MSPTPPTSEARIEQVARAIDPELWVRIDNWRHHARVYRETPLEKSGFANEAEKEDIAKDCDRKADKNAQASFTRALAAIEAGASSPLRDGLTREAKLKQVARALHELRRHDLNIYGPTWPYDEEHPEGQRYILAVAEAVHAALSSSPPDGLTGELAEALEPFAKIGEIGGYPPAHFIFGLTGVDGGWHCVRFGDFLKATTTLTRHREAAARPGLDEQGARELPINIAVAVGYLEGVMEHEPAEVAKQWATVKAFIERPLP